MHGGKKKAPFRAFAGAGLYKAMKNILKAIDTINEWVGNIGKWLTVALIVVVVTEVVMRYVFNRPTTQGPMIAIWTGAAMYALSWGYVHLCRRHVRVDVFYTRFSLRVKNIIDVVCAVFFLLPLIGLMTFAGWKWTRYAWSTMERTQETYWYPIMGPIRTIVFLGLVLFTLQGLAQFFRDFYSLIRNKSL